MEYQLKPVVYKLNERLWRRSRGIRNTVLVYGVVTVWTVICLLLTVGIAGWVRSIEWISPDVGTHILATIALILVVVGVRVMMEVKVGPIRKRCLEKKTIETDDEYCKKIAAEMKQLQDVEQVLGVESLEDVNWVCVKLIRDSIAWAYEINDEQKISADDDGKSLAALEPRKFGGMRIGIFFSALGVYFGYTECMENYEAFCRDFRAKTVRRRDVKDLVLSVYGLLVEYEMIGVPLIRNEDEYV